MMPMNTPNGSGIYTDSLKNPSSISSKNIFSASSESCAAIRVCSACPLKWERALELLRAWAADPEAFELDEEHDPSLRRPGEEPLRIPRLLPRAVVDAHRAASGAAEELRTETERRLLRAMEEIERILARRP